MHLTNDQCLELFGSPRADLICIADAHTLSVQAWLSSRSPIAKTFKGIGVRASSTGLKLPLLNLALGANFPEGQTILEAVRHVAEAVALSKGKSLTAAQLLEQCELDTGDRHVDLVHERGRVDGRGHVVRVVRVVLQLLDHVDPLGTVLFPALMALGVGIPLAWGKPVQISESPRHLTRRFSLRTIRLMISVAGPAMNLALALLLSVVFLLVARLGGGAFFYEHILQLVALNFGLLFFNLLPIPPLDGRSLLAFLPDSLAVVRDALTRYGGFIFLALICIGGFGQGPGPLQYLMLPFTLFTRIYLGWLLQLGGLG